MFFSLLLEVPWFRVIILPSASWSSRIVALTSTSAVAITFLLSGIVLRGYLLGFCGISLFIVGIIVVRVIFIVGFRSVSSVPSSFFELVVVLFLLVIPLISSLTVATISPASSPSESPTSSR